MADEIEKLKKQLQDQADAWVRNVDEQSDKVVKFVNDSTRDLQKLVQAERRKLELRSEIGEHTRALNKAYVRLGEACFEAQESGKKDLGDNADLFDLIRNKRRLIELLQEQLETLEAAGK
jgi:predicted ATPase